ncbi:MAG: ABC transporter substrate-binding protein, partial [Acidimicrobiia bacterium]|nr:ABC transporter substrate-binding protein [Acidimicrobiia bacterium]
ILVALTMLAAACAEDAETTTTTAETTTTEATTSTTELAACTVDNLNLVTPGTLTIATGLTVFPPWMTDADGGFNDDPTAQSGFEGELAYEIADYLGFAAEQVEWVRTGFDEAIVAGPKDWDFNMQQYSITTARDEVVDFSVPYYVTSQALVVLDGSPLQNATTLAELKDAKLGAAIGTTSVEFIESVIQPSTPPNVYDENFDVVSAMNAGQIEGLVVDLGAAFYITGSEQVPGSVVAASFDAEAAAPDEYGLLFAEGNPLVECVNEAINALWADGTIDRLIADWLEQGIGVTVISE